MSEKIEFFSAILLVSKDAKRLATFYRDVLGIALEEEKHGDTLTHYGCELGDLHFAIHPAGNFEGSGCEPGAVRLAFNVFDMNAFEERVTSRGVELVYPPKDVGFATMTALQDPDGNFVEFTQLSDGWFNHLKSRRNEGVDVINRWERKQAQTRRS